MTRRFIHFVNITKKKVGFKSFFFCAHNEQLRDFFLKKHLFSPSDSIQLRRKRNPSRPKPYFFPFRTITFSVKFQIKSTAVLIKIISVVFETTFKFVIFTE